jgi:hypothetical protein
MAGFASLYPPYDCCLSPRQRPPILSKQTCAREIVSDVNLDARLVRPLPQGLGDIVSDYGEVRFGNAYSRGEGAPGETGVFRRDQHAGAYWLLWSMRRLMPKGSTGRVMQFDTLRLRLIKLAARVVELKTQIKIPLPSSAPDQAIFAMLLDRLPRRVT